MCALQSQSEEVRLGSVTSDVGVEARLSALERSSRRWRLIAVAGMLGLGGSWLGGWMAAEQGAAGQGGENPRSIQTQQLIITGSDNQPRIMMTGTADGSSLFLYGTDAYKGRGGGQGGGQGGGGGAGGGGGMGGVVSLSPRIRLMADKEGPRIEVLDGDGRRRVLIHVGEEGPTIERLDAEGKVIDQEG